MWSMLRPVACRLRAFLGRNGTLELHLQKIDRQHRITALARSIIFDRAFYELQAKVRFHSSRQAVAHFLDTGLDLGLSISPFFQEEWYTVHTAAKHGPRFLWFFFHAEGLSTTAPCFDARVYAAEQSKQGLPVPTTGREALEAFLSQANASTHLPVHRLCIGRPTVGEARARALECARRNNEHAHLARARLSGKWEPPVTAAPPAATGASSRVSVIMPVRNRAEIVPAAIRSVLEQTCTNWQLIVVDDGSDDDTAQVVAGFAALDPRVQLIRQAPSGVCAARNAGLRAADGEYVAFIDSDNAWVPQFLETSLRALDGASVIGVHAAVELKDERGQSQYLAFSGDRDDLLYGGNFIDLNTLVTRRTALLEIGGFDEDLRRWVDYDLVIRLFEIGDFLFLPFVGVIYSHRGDLTRISTTEPPGWEQVVLTKYLLDWDTIIAGLPEREIDLVSVVMLTYADWNFTLQAVRSVLDHSGSVAFELIVVDNGSPRAVHEILCAALAGDTRVRLIPLPRNTNFALGSNIGFSASTGDRVVFLNNDVRVQANWLAPLVERLTADLNVGAVQSLIVTPAGGVESSGLVIEPPDFLPRDTIELRSQTEPEFLDAVSAVAVMFRADDFAAQRGFDPIFSNGLEDADLALRLAQAGHRKFAVAADSVVTHYSSYSPGRFAATTVNERVFTGRWRAALQRRLRSGCTSGVAL